MVKGQIGEFVRSNHFTALASLPGHSITHFLFPDHNKYLGDGTPPGIPSGPVIGIEADQFSCLDPGFFQQFPSGSLFQASLPFP